MTNERIGEIIRWLCSIPADGGIQILVKCDDCDMQFGTVHRCDAGWIIRIVRYSLGECLEEAWSKKGEIEEWLKKRRANDLPKL